MEDKQFLQEIVTCFYMCRVIFIVIFPFCIYMFYVLVQIWAAIEDTKSDDRLVYTFTDTGDNGMLSEGQRICIDFIATGPQLTNNFNVDDVSVRFCDAYTLSKDSLITL